MPPLKLCTHPLQIPSSLASSIPDKFEYWDEVRYDPKFLAEPPYELQVQSEAPFLGEKVRGHPHCCPFNRCRCPPSSAAIPVSDAARPHSCGDGVLAVQSTESFARMSQYQERSCTATQLR